MPSLACDVGGTDIKIGIVRADRVIARATIPAWADRGLEAALPRIAAACDGLRAEAGFAKEDLRGFGLAFPGIVDPETERIVSTPAGKFDDAREIDVRRVARPLLGLPVRVVNDANAALNGEWAWGAAAGCRDVAMLTLGTGIGSSVVLDGVPLRGRHGQAGNLGGHLVARVNGRRCTCGGIGCAEAEASGWAIVELAMAHPRFAASRLAAEPQVDYRAVFALAAEGDEVAQELRDRSVCVWAAAVVSMIHAYDLERVILGGGVMRAGEAILEPVRDYVARHAWTPWGRVEVLPAALGNDAGMLGAAWLVEQG
jgi:glucokinase